MPERSFQCLGHRWLWLRVGAAILCLLPLDVLARSKADAPRRQEFLDMFSLAFWPGRSGQVLFCPERDHFWTSETAPYNHGGPWEWDRRVPMLLWGPGFVRPGTYDRPCDLRAIAATQAQVLGIARHVTMTGRPLLEALRPTAVRPRLIVVVVFDQCGGDLLFGPRMESLPTLRRLKAQGAWFTQCILNQLQSATGPSHATIGTGALPCVHGVTSMYAPDFAKGRLGYLWEGRQPTSVLLCPTLADIWDAHTQSRAIVYSQCYAPRAAAGMAGHGSAYAYADRDFLVIYDVDSASPTTISPAFLLPPYLRAKSGHPWWKRCGGLWMGHDIANGDDFRYSAIFVDFMAECLLEAVRREPFGQDDTTDLLFVNFKATDAVGHRYGHGSPEFAETLAAEDRALGRVLAALESKIDPQSLLVLFTADHGVVPPKPGFKKVIISRFLRRLREHLGLRGPSGKQVIAGAAPYHIFVDREGLAAHGRSLEDVAAWVARQKGVYCVFTEDEVAANQSAALKRDRLRQVQSR